MASTLGRGRQAREHAGGEHHEQSHHRLAGEAAAHPAPGLRGGIARERGRQAQAVRSREPQQGANSTIFARATSP